MAVAAIVLRKPCAECGNSSGTIERKNLQDTVRCSDCGRYQYNAPRTETGEREETVTTVHNGIKPKQRARILQRANGRCELCGSRENLHAGHIVSVESGTSIGLPAHVLNDDENLIALCAECNLGIGDETIPLKLAAAILRTRASR